MDKTSKRWTMKAGIGQFVLYSAIIGAVRLAIALACKRLPATEADGILFVISTLLLGALAAYFYGRSQKFGEDTW